MRWNESHLPGPLLHKLLSPGLCAFPTQLTKLFSVTADTSEANFNDSYEFRWWRRTMKRGYIYRKDSNRFISVVEVSK